jgi:carbon-monoxide dehydrogenase medium subunit
VRLPDFDFLEPQSVAEACALLTEDPEGSAVLAGGTDVLVYLKEGVTPHRRLVSLHRIDGLERITCTAEDGLSIGAMATVNQVARHPAVQELYPGVVDAALCLAADQVRNQATVAGNLCTAVPSADTAPILLAHDATLRVAGPDGERTMPLREFFLGPRRTALETGEVVVAIEVPPPAQGQGDASQRHGGRVSLSLPIASAAATVVMDGGVCRRAAVALGAVAPTPLLVDTIAELLEGSRLDRGQLEQAGTLAAAAARPIDDLRGTAAHRLDLVRVLTRRVLRDAAERSGV